MSLRLLVLIGSAVLTMAPFPGEAQQAVFVVRHAERLDASEDSPLSEAGHGRAQALANLLKDAGINAIYTSELQRTIKTAEPLAKRLQVEINRVPQYDGADMEKLIGHLRAQHGRDTVLVVGHSNTLPAVIRGLGHPGEIKFGRDEYDLLMVLVPRGEGRPVLLRLRF